MRKVNTGRGQALPLKEIQADSDSTTGSEKERFQSCLDAAVRFLNYRPRSEFEVRQRLKQQGFKNECVDSAVAELKKRGLLNDIAFAESWRDDRDAFNPRSQKLIGLELRQKGINGDIISQVTDALDDEDSAYRAASLKAHVWSKNSYDGFRHHLGAYLQRRGFSYRVINRAVEKVWQELTPESTPLKPDPDAQHK